MSFFNVLNLPLINLRALAPLSGQAFETGREIMYSATVVNPNCG